AEREARSHLLQFHSHLQFHLNKLTLKLNRPEAGLIGTRSFEPTPADKPRPASAERIAPFNVISDVQPIRPSLYGSRSMDPMPRSKSAEQKVANPPDNAIDRKRSKTVLHRNYSSPPILSLAASGCDPAVTPSIPTRKSTRNIKTAKKERLGSVDSLGPPHSPQSIPSESSADDLKEDRPKTKPAGTLPPPAVHGSPTQPPDLGEQSSLPTPHPSPPRLPVRATGTPKRKRVHLPGGPLPRDVAHPPLSTRLLLYIFSHFIFAILAIIGYEKLLGIVGYTGDSNLNKFKSVHK
ncbi:hypothetical protein HDU91_004186, partial [Kappamyces sp. JEL0680]